VTGEPGAGPEALDDTDLCIGCARNLSGLRRWRRLDAGNSYQVLARCVECERIGAPSLREPDTLLD
jgi:predicted Fe-S protein YdhL (DUF1289 family)